MRFNGKMYLDLGRAKSPNRG